VITENVLVQAVIVIGSVLTTYLTVKYKDNILGKDKKENEEEPRTRMDTIFDGYEKLIQQQQEDIIRKQSQLDRTDQLIAKLQKDLDDTRAIVARQHTELDEQKKLNDELRKQLDLMKKQRTKDGV
jgi:hypothetical protein